MKFCDIAFNTSGHSAALTGDYGKIDSDWPLVEYLVTLVAWDIRHSGWAWEQEDCEFMSARGPVVLEIMKLLGLEDYLLGSWRQPHKKHKCTYHTHKETTWRLGGPPERDVENAGGDAGRTPGRTLRVIVKF
jgi:hypothetical protein